MRLLDWGQVIDDAKYEPTLFDEIVIRLGDDLYALEGFQVILKGGDEGPGVVAYVAGSRVQKLEAQDTEGR